MAFTSFFRDSQTLELAIDAALPSLGGRAFIHVWGAGCAHGPEPYTLAILLRERMSDYIFRNVHIHATRPTARGRARRRIAAPLWRVAPATSESAARAI